MAGLEAGFSDAWLALFSVQSPHGLDPVRHKLHTLRPFWLGRFLGGLSGTRNVPELLHLVSLKLLEHGLLGAEKLLLLSPLHIEGNPLLLLLHLSLGFKELLGHSHSITLSFLGDALLLS